MAYGTEKDYNFIGVSDKDKEDAKIWLNKLNANLPEGLNIDNTIYYADAMSLAHGKHKEEIMTFLENISIFNNNVNMASNNQTYWRGQVKGKISDITSFRKVISWIRAFNKQVEKADDNHKFTWSIVNYSRPFA